VDGARKTVGQELGVPNHEVDEQRRAGAALALPEVGVAVRSTR
jgi:hypothetical protein